LSMASSKYEKPAGLSLAGCLIRLYQRRINCT
jgi:hypothetical protein